MSNPKPCPRCSGRMFLEVYDLPCQNCRETGATSCQNDRISLEWSCLMCGHVIYERTFKRSKLNVPTVPA